MHRVGGHWALGTIGHNDGHLNYTAVCIVTTFVADDVHH